MTVIAIVVIIVNYLVMMMKEMTALERSLS